MRLSESDSTLRWISNRLNAMPKKAESIDIKRARALALFGAAAGLGSASWLLQQAFSANYSLASAVTAAGAVALAATFLFLRLFRTTFYGGIWFATWLFVVLATQTFAFGGLAPYLFCLLVPLPVVFALTWGALASVCATLLVSLSLLFSGVNQLLGREEPHPDFFAFLLIAAVCTLTSGVFIALFSRYREKEQDQLIQAEKQLRHSVSVDPLTGILNRRAFDQAIIDLKLQGHRQLPPALILFDLDKFKLINDTFGHSAGDHVLREISARVAEQLAEGQSFFRLGGDEFAIILQQSPSPQDLMKFANGLISQTSKPILLANSSIRVDLSLGAAIAEFGASDVGELYSRADTASFLAKEESGSKAVLFNKRLSSKVVRRNAVEARLNHALIHKGIDVAFQPQVDIRTQGVVGFESLARWTDAKLGAVTPDEFVRVAEESALIDRFDRFIIETSLEHARHWLGPVRRLSMNVSARSIVSAEFCRFVMSQIRRSGFQPGQIELEITETALIENWTACRKNISVLRHLGVRIVLDDFGIGYSSLSYLSQFPVQKLKFDKSFLSQIDSASAVLVMKAIVQLAEALDMEVVAEGVDDIAQVAVLKQLQCMTAQGFLYSRPIMSSDMPAYISTIDQAKAIEPLQVCA